MSTLDITISVATPVVTFALGRATPRLSSELRARHAKRFWAPVAKTSTVVILGRLDSAGREPSGLLGLGSMRALTSLNRHLRELYIAEPPALYVDQLQGVDLGAYTTIVLGGPGANTVFGELSDVLPIGWQFLLDDNSRSGLFDTTSGNWYGTTFNDAGDVICDHGLIVRARNPFGARTHDRHVFAFAGCTGFGTLAAVEYATYSRFLNAPLVADGEPMECIVRATIGNGMHRSIDAVAIRALSDATSARQ